MERRVGLGGRAPLAMDFIQPVAESFRYATTARTSRQRRHGRLRARDNFCQLRLRQAGGKNLGYLDLWVHVVNSITFALIRKEFISRLRLVN